MVVSGGIMSQDQIQKITDKLDEVKNDLSKEIQAIQLRCVEHSHKLNLLWEERSKKPDTTWKIISTLIAICSVLIAVNK